MFNYDLRNETLNLVDDFILDHIDDFSEEELYWIIEEVEKLSKSFYRKFKDLIDEDIESLADEIEGED
jgi:hypothetical protein